MREQGNGLSNSTPRAGNTARSSNRSFQRENSKLRTVAAGKEMQGEADLDDFLDHEDNLKYGLTYYIKTCLKLDRSSVRPESEFSHLKLASCQSSCLDLQLNKKMKSLSPRRSRRRAPRTRPGATSTSRESSSSTQRTASTSTSPT